MTLDEFLKEMERGRGGWKLVAAPGNRRCLRHHDPTFEAEPWCCPVTFVLGITGTCIPVDTAEMLGMQESDLTDLINAVDDNDRTPLIRNLRHRLLVAAGLER